MKLTIDHQAILGITEAFKADTNPKKINLGQYLMDTMITIATDMRRCWCLPRRQGQALRPALREAGREEGR